MVQSGSKTELGSLWWGGSWWRGEGQKTDFHTRDPTEGKWIPITSVLKSDRAWISEFLQPVKLKAWKFRALGSWEPALKRTAPKTVCAEATTNQQFCWGQVGVRVTYLFQSMSWRGRDHRETGPKTKELQVSSPSLDPSINAGLLVGTSMVPILTI